MELQSAPMIEELAGAFGHGRTARSKVLIVGGYTDGGLRIFGQDADPVN